MEKSYLPSKKLFAQKCMVCHGDDPKKIKGDLDMRSRESLLLGGKRRGRSLDSSQGEKFSLYSFHPGGRGHGNAPKEADKLTEEQTWWIRDWINEGLLGQAKNGWPSFRKNTRKGNRW